jgi:hypothetical protein
MIMRTTRVAAVALLAAVFLAPAMRATAQTQLVNLSYDPARVIFGFHAEFAK